ncbi:unnamed protein product [Arctogadus glacialis]
MDVFICETYNSHITPQGPTAARRSLGSAQCGRAEVRPSPQLFEESAAAAARPVALYSLSPPSRECHSRGAVEQTDSFILPVSADRQLVCAQWETGPAMHHRPTVSYEYNYCQYYRWPPICPWSPRCGHTGAGGLDRRPDKHRRTPLEQSPNGRLFPVARDRAFPFVPEEKNKSEGDCVGNDGD